MWFSSVKCCKLVFQEDSTQARSHVLFEGHQGMYSKLWQKPLDLQLSADQYISHVGKDLQRKGIFTIT